MKDKEDKKTKDTMTFEEQHKNEWHLSKNDEPFCCNKLGLKKISHYLDRNKKFLILAQRNKNIRKTKRTSGQRTQ